MDKFWATCIILAGLALAASVTGGDVTAMENTAGRTTYGLLIRPLIEVADGEPLLNVYGPGYAIVGTHVAQNGSWGPPGPISVDDHLGSARVSIGASGDAAVHHEYAPYGNTPSNGGRYAGHPYDARQVVYQTPSRQYDPSGGRFLSMDPQRQGASPYIYAGSDPIDYLDPSGTAYVPLPYFMETNTESNPNYYMNSKYVVRALWPIGDHRASNSSMFQSRPDYQGKRWRHGRFSSPFAINFKQSIEGRMVNGDKYWRTPEFYWIIGGNEKVDLPDELVPMLDDVGSLQRGALQRIIILDFTGTGTGEENQDRLSSLGRRSLVINAQTPRLSRGGGQEGLPDFTVNTGDTQIPMTRSEFRGHVHQQIERTWGSPPTIVAPPQPSGNPPAPEVSHPDPGHVFTPEQLGRLVLELSPEFNPNVVVVPRD